MDKAKWPGAPTRRSTLRAAAAALLAGPVALGAKQAWAAWPSGTVAILVPFAPGGASDLAARLLGEPLSASLGQNVIVRNRAGANGNIGIASVASAKPDGYTLLMASSVLVVNPSLYPNLSYDPVQSFEPITDIAASPNVLVARPDSGFKDLAGLVAYAKTNPGKLNFSSPGTGSISQLAVEILKLRTGIELTHVPYEGAGPATVAVLGGQVQLGSVNISSVIGHIKSGTLVGIVQTGAKRWPELPNIPTMEEAGIPNSVSETDQALLAPAHTPPEIIKRISDALEEILRVRRSAPNCWPRALARSAELPTSSVPGLHASYHFGVEVIHASGIHVS